jgi:hypothetical protein
MTAILLFGALAAILAWWWRKSPGVNSVGRRDDA